VTQKNTSKTSELADEGSGAPSVLDFLYHDSRRIGSFLSQFEGDGHLEKLTRTKDGSRGKKENSAHEIKGNVGLAGGIVKGGTETALEMAEGYSRVFDPYWANARAFLDYLNDNDMIQRDMSAANVGQFVLAKGYLSVLDLVMFKEAWKLPSLQRIIKAGMLANQPTGNLTAAQKAAAKEQKSQGEMVLDLIQIMPHSVHASLLVPGDDPHMVWCPLREEYMSTPASELVLMHGVRIPGEWSILGVMSAPPDYVVAGLNPVADESEPGFMQSMVGQVSNLIAPLVRVALGRPAVASAITPLLIFREVSKDRAEI
jgi:hypothetical protein